MSVYDENSSEPVVIPPLRIEFPPSCGFKWNVETVNSQENNQILQSCEMVSSTMHVTNPGLEAERILVGKRPIPTYEENGADALLKATGLTPQRLKERRDSWTIRAIIARAT